MPTKKEQLEAIADPLPLISDGEIPHGVNLIAQPDRWNPATQALKDAFPLLGDFFLDTDGQHAALLALFLAHHDADTGENAPPEEWVADVGTGLAFLNSTQFQLAGDRRADFARGQRVRATVGANDLIVAILQVVFGGGATTITVDQPVLGAGLAAIARGLVRTSQPKVLVNDIIPGSTLANHVEGVPIGNVYADGVEHDVVVLPAITTRGGPVELFGAVSMSLVPSGVGVPENQVLTLRVRRNTLPPEQPVDEVQYFAGADFTGFAVPTPRVYEVPPPGTHIYRLTAQSTFGGTGHQLYVGSTLAMTLIGLTKPGRFHAVERA